MAMMGSSTPAQLAVLVLLTIVVSDAVRRFTKGRERSGSPLPPGPTPLPLLGNILSIDSKGPWLTYTKWRAKYGDIVYFRLLGADMVVLNSPSVVKELLEKRSQIYSDRPFIATVKPFGHDYNFAQARYGEHWRLCRRIFNQTFRAEASLAFRPMQLRRARQMIVNIMNDPEDYPSHYATFAAAVAMSSVYDYETKPRDDPVVSAFDAFLQLSFPLITPEKATVLKVFPFLLHVPDWFPGSRIKLKAKEALRLREKTIEMSYEHVRKRMESNDNVGDSMVFNHLNRMKAFDDSYRARYELALKHASTTAFIGALETTSTVIMSFTLAMVKNPQVWQRAQEEIDTALGIDRLPEFEDRRSLPYVNAIMQETLRSNPVLPLGVPHATICSDVYNGFYIPKGTTVVGNVWGILRDGERYPNPDAFCPERFLDAQGRLIKDELIEFIFGFGRRTCPGRYVADTSIWCAIATMLATFEFRPAKDENGKDELFEAVFTNGLTYRPHTFPCRLTPRAHINKEMFESVLAQ